MRGKATNLALLALGWLQMATGAGAFLTGTAVLRPVIWLHAAGGFSIVLLLWWKRRIITRSLARRPLGPWALPGLASLVLVLGVLATGVGWSTAGLPALAGYPAMTIHVVLASGLLALLTLHSVRRWPRVRRADIAGRRALMRGGVLLAGGALLWRGTEAGSRLFHLSGAGRRFTGSRSATSFSGNDFPSSNWLTDDPAPLDPASWSLTVGGHVQQRLTRSIADLKPEQEQIALLDCTGGWYTEQRWSGVSLASLMDEAGAVPGARSVVVRASTGYWRRYTIAEARSALLATHVGGVPLAHEHGAPMRLVIPGKRGYEWVKWVTSIEVSTASPLLKWPLPVS